MSPKTCVVCSSPWTQAWTREFTCSEDCHRRYLDAVVLQFGETKRVVDMATGKTHIVPTRLIAEKGIKQQDLHQFPEANV